MATAFLDRFEGELAVLVVQGQELRLPRSELPKDALEGSYLTMRFILDHDAEKAGREEQQQLRSKLSREDDGGDIGL